MTKEEIINVVTKSKCKMLDKLPLHIMNRDDIIDHLKNSCCPVLRSLCEA